jgi:hypothetical protein
LFCDCEALFVKPIFKDKDFDDAPGKLPQGPGRSGGLRRKKTRSAASARSDGPAQYERLFELARSSAGRNRGTHEETPRHSVVPRRVKTIEEVILLWRHGDPSKGSDYPLRRIQTAADRNTVIKGYTNAWWEHFGHKDALSRYRILVKGVVSALEPGRINMREAGSDVDWEAALALFHDRWDRHGQPQPMTVLVSKLRCEQKQCSMPCGRSSP